MSICSFEVLSHSSHWSLYTSTTTAPKPHSDQQDPSQSGFGCRFSTASRKRYTIEQNTPSPDRMKVHNYFSRSTRAVRTCSFVSVRVQCLIQLSQSVYPKPKTLNRVDPKQFCDTIPRQAAIRPRNSTTPLPTRRRALTSPYKSLSQLQRLLYGFLGQANRPDLEFESLGGCVEDRVSSWSYMIP